MKTKGLLGLLSDILPSSGHMVLKLFVFPKDPFLVSDETLCPSRGTGTWLSHSKRSIYRQTGIAGHPSTVLVYSCFSCIIINSVLYFQKCPIWTKSYMVMLSIDAYYIYGADDFEDSVVKLDKMAKLIFSLSLLIFMVKFIFVVNTSIVIILK